MNYDELESFFNLHENANAAEQDLLDAAFFDDYFAKKFEVSVLPVLDKDNEDFFYLVVKVESKGAKLSEDHAEEIADAVTDKFFDLLLSVKTENELDELRNFFSGTQMYLNGKQLY